MAVAVVVVVVAEVEAATEVFTIPAVVAEAVAVDILL